MGFARNDVIHSRWCGRPLTWHKKKSIIFTSITLGNSRPQSQLFIRSESLEGKKPTAVAVLKVNSFNCVIILYFLSYFLAQPINGNYFDSVAESLLAKHGLSPLHVYIRRHHHHYYYFLSSKSLRKVNIKIRSIFLLKLWWLNFTSLIKCCWDRHWTFQ